jgi:hypothetical protein
MSGLSLLTRAVWEVLLAKYITASVALTFNYHASSTTATKYRYQRGLWKNASSDLGEKNFELVHNSFHV